MRILDTIVETTPDCSTNGGPRNMPNARIEPAGIDIEVDDGEALMAAGQRAGLLWPTVCNGMGSCRTCYVTVVEGAENLSTIEAWEKEGLEALSSSVPSSQSLRLACQALVHGDVVVHKRGVRRRPVR